MLFNLTIGTPSPLIALGALVFNGTGVWLNSALVSPNVPYTVSFDSQQFPAMTAQAGPSTFFSAPGLAATSTHSLAITPVAVLDSVVVQMDLDADLEMTVDDSELFSSSDATVQGTWNANQCLGTGRVMGTCHTSDGANSEISYTFQGDAITVWGSLENTRARYSVSIDGATAQSYSSGNFSSPRPSTVLAHASNLGSGKHTITIISSPLDGTSRVEIDYLQLYTLTSAAVPSGAVPGSSPGIQMSRTTKIAVIVGSIVGCVVIAVTWLIILLMRQKAQMRKAAAAEHGEPSFNQRPDMDADSMYVSKTKEFDMETVASSVASTKRDAPGFTVQTKTKSFHPLDSSNSWRA